ncbi:phospho-N-acetylmuramoyl-pentapeptide-transferase [Candidatus Sumerlaeota bacterium]|nr:phospho-N-acetylmuramoyl-pentapeptide-transferase [Candidatus Sumerlaeota bacterium]
MIPWLIDLWEPEGPLRVLRYITFRGALGLTMAFALSLALGPAVIHALRRLKMGQPILTITHREGSLDLSQMHGSKAGTPTMGGLLILVSMLVPALLMCDLRWAVVWALLLLMIGLGFLGGLDDYLKITRSHSRGLLPRYKLAGQLILGLLFGLALLGLPARMQPSYHHTVDAEGYQEMFIAWGSDVQIIDAETTPPGDTFHVMIRGHSHVMVPFFKNLYPSLGWFYLLWAALVIIASSNAVNLTDGLDGLAIGVTAMVALCFTVIAYIVARPALAQYLIIPTVPGGGEVAVLLGCLIGAAMGFLWFNAHPAEVFMGDVGSLAIGGLLGGVALVLQMELLLVIVGGIFVIEALSVIIQVGGYKMTGKRVFLMAPIHHHFERRGWHESKIIARFYIIGAILALFGLATLKLR